jgi:ABC-type multidrug transport system permease subunit
MTSSLGLFYKFLSLGILNGLLILARSELTETANILTIAVAPVFLISGIGMLLNIMSTRYGRVIDRTRFLLREGDRIYNQEITGDHLKYELRVLYKRAKHLQWTVMLASAAIFCICLTITFVFAERLLEVPIFQLAPSFFLAALIFLLASVALLLSDFRKSMVLIKHDLQVRAPDAAEQD